MMVMGRRRGTAAAAWAVVCVLLCVATAVVQAFSPSPALQSAWPARRLPRRLHAGENEAAASTTSSPASKKAKASTAFISPAIPPSASVGDLLEYLGDQNTRRRAARRLLKQPEQVPAEGLVELLKATCRLGNTGGCQKLLAMLRAMGTPPDVPLYETLLKMSNKRFTWDLSLALLHEAEQEDGLPLTPGMLGGTLYSCLQSDRPHEAVKLLKRFQKHGSKPLVSLLMFMIRLLSDKGMVSALREVSAALATLGVEGDAALYTSLVAAFGRAGSYEDVVSSAVLVEGKGVADKGRIYSTGVAALLEGDLPSPARELYERALRDGAVISRKGYEVLISGASLSSDPSQAVFFLQEFKTAVAAAAAGASPGGEEGAGGEGEQRMDGTPVPAKVYWRPISACLRTKRLTDAADLMLEYYNEVEGTASDPVPLNNLIKATCDSGSAEDRALAVRVYEAITAAQPTGVFVGNSFTSMILIGAYRRTQELEKIVGLHQAMLAAGVDVWLPAASNIMYAYAKQGDVEAELQTFKALAASPAQIQLAGTQNKASGKSKRKDSTSAPGPPPISPQQEKHLFLWERLLSRAMYLASEHHRLETASLVLSLLQKYPGLRASGATDYMNLIKAFSHASRPGDALQVIMIMNQRKGEAKPSTLHYNAVLHAFTRLERLADAEAVFEEMRMRQVSMDAATFNMLISGFERARQPDRALALYEEMTKRGIQADAYVLNSMISVTADLRNRTLANGLLTRFRTLAGDPEEASNDIMFGAFMHALAKADVGSRREALALLETFKASGRIPNTIMYNEAMYVTYRLVREDPVGMSDKALSLYHEMLSHGPASAPTPLTYRRLFKCLKQACRFQELAEVAATLPRDMLVTHDRLGIPAILASLRVGQSERARDLLGDLVLKPNTTYATYRWAAFVCCTKLDPPDLAAAETILGLVEERGWKADRGFYGSLLRGCWAATPKQIEKAFDVYHNLPPAFQGGDPAAVAALCHVDRGRLDRVAGLLQEMRDRDDVAGADILVMLLESLLISESWKNALSVVELMIDFELSMTRPQRRLTEALVHANPKGPALEVLEGLALLTVRHEEEVEVAVEGVLVAEEEEEEE
jgi:pentatricopeptide repeat protein